MQAARGARELRQVRDGVRPRPHQVHLTLQDVEQLRQLVQAVAAQPFPQRRDPLGIVAFPFGMRAVDGMHRPELDETEGPSAASDALLDEEHGAPGVEPDGHRDDREHRQAHQQSQRGQRQAEHPCQDELPSPRLEVVGVHDAAGRQRLERELAGEPFERLDGALDVDSSGASFEQQDERQAHAGGQADDDPVGTRGIEGEGELVDVLDHTHDGPAEIAAPVDLLDDPARERLRAEHQHALPGPPATAHALTHTGAEQQGDECDEENQARAEPQPDHRHRRGEDVDVHSTVTLLARLRG